jgi:hypothetical protein
MAHLPVPSGWDILGAIFSVVWWIGTKADPDEGWQAISRGALAFSIADYARRIVNWNNDPLSVREYAWVYWASFVGTFFASGWLFKTSDQLAERRRRLECQEPPNGYPRTKRTK